MDRKNEGTGDTIADRRVSEANLALCAGGRGIAAGRGRASAIMRPDSGGEDE